MSHFPGFGYPQSIPIPSVLLSPSLRLSSSESCAQSSIPSQNAEPPVIGKSRAASPPLPSGLSRGFHMIEGLPPGTAEAHRGALALPLPLRPPLSPIAECRTGGEERRSAEPGFSGEEL